MINKKKPGWFIVLILFVIELFYGIADQGDRILEYAYEKSLKLKNDNLIQFESNIFKLSKFHLKLGDIKHTIKGLKILTDEYYKYSIIFGIYNMDDMLSESDFQKVLEFHKDNKFN